MEYYVATIKRELELLESLQTDGSCSCGDSGGGEDGNCVSDLSPRRIFFYVLQARGVGDECLLYYADEYLGVQGVLWLMQHEFRIGRHTVSDALARVASRINGYDDIFSRDYFPELDILAPVPNLDGAERLLKNAILRAAYRLPPLAIDRPVFRGADWLRRKLLSAYARMGHPEGFVATACANQQKLTMRDLLDSRCCPVKIILPVLSAESPEMSAHRDAMFGAIRMPLHETTTGAGMAQLRLPPGYQFPSTAAAHELVASGCVAVDRNRFGTGEDWISVLSFRNVHQSIRRMVARWVRTSRGDAMTILASIRDELHQPNATVPIPPKILSSAVVSKLEELTRDVRDPPHEFEKMTPGDLVLYIHALTGTLYSTHEPLSFLMTKLADAIKHFGDAPAGDQEQINLRDVASSRQHR